MTALAKIIKTQDSRPFSLNDDEVNLLETVIKSLMLVEQLADEYNPSMATIPAELVGEFLGLATNNLQTVLDAAHNSAKKGA